MRCREFKLVSNIIRGRNEAKFCLPTPSVLPTALWHLLSMWQVNCKCNGYLEKGEIT